MPYSNLNSDVMCSGITFKGFWYLEDSADQIQKLIFSLFYTALVLTQMSWFIISVNKTWGSRMGFNSFSSCGLPRRSHDNVLSLFFSPYPFLRRSHRRPVVIMQEPPSWPHLTSTSWWDKRAESTRTTSHIASETCRNDSGWELGPRSGPLFGSS